MPPAVSPLKMYISLKQVWLYMANKSDRLKVEQFCWTKNGISVYELMQRRTSLWTWDKGTEVQQQQGWAGLHLQVVQSNPTMAATFCFTTEDIKATMRGIKTKKKCLHWFWIFFPDLKEMKTAFSSAEHCPSHHVHSIAQRENPFRITWTEAYHTAAQCSVELGWALFRTISLSEEQSGEK